MNKKLLSIILSSIIATGVGADYIIKQKLTKGLSFDKAVGFQGYSFTSHRFSSCGLDGGRLGPTLSQCRISYETNWDENDNNFNITTQGIQEWTVPETGTYRITAGGARGGDTGYNLDTWGAGAVIRGDFNLIQGEIINILVGQRGEEGNERNDYGQNSPGGGGGGSFVWKKGDSLPLIVAGGGGGGVQNNSGYGGKGSTTETPSNSTGNSAGNGLGGSNGNGGSAGNNVGIYSSGAGGSGWLSNGQRGLTIRRAAGYGGYSPLNGGMGGDRGDAGPGVGGFGGGGAGSDNTGASGGGGGYNGGGGGNNYLGSGRWGAGGGGSSYNAGANPTVLGTNTGNGFVDIEKL